MPATSKLPRVTITIDDPEMVDTIREIAAERRLPMREVVARLLRRGLDALEDEADLAALAETEGEETYPWEQVKAEMERARQGHHAA